MTQWLLVLILFFPACAPTLQHHERVEKNLLAHQYTDADQVVEKSKKRYGDRNALLYWLDRGMLLHFAGRYQESNAFFEKAKLRVEGLYTESVMAHAGAMISNDNVLPYEGEDFEKVLIPLFSALNYAAMSEWDEALVEARQADALLNRLNERYEKKNVYQKDALARYLSGLLYETRNETNDAFIAYRKSYEAFEDYQKHYHTDIPFRLKLDLLRTAGALHLEEEFETYQKLFAAAASRFPLREKPSEGELVAVVYAGRSPVKKDFFINALIPNGYGGTYLLAVALPKFEARPSDVAHIEVRLRQGEKRDSMDLDLFEDVTAIAKKNLEDSVARITTKAIARATTKYLATREARLRLAPDKNDPIGRLIGLIGNVYTVATEESDKRSWRTLPGRIYLGRTLLPAGVWEVEVRYLTRQGILIESRHFSNIVIEAGKKRFLLAHTIR